MVTKNPYAQICVCKHNGKEVGRIAASAKNASQYIDDLVRTHGPITIEYEEDEIAAMVDQALFGTKYIRQ